MALAAINVKRTARSANTHVNAPRSANEERNHPSSPTMMKRCTICREMKPLSAFNLDSHRPDGHMFVCRRCQQLRLTRCAIGSYVGLFRFCIVAIYPQRAKHAIKDHIHSYAVAKPLKPIRA